jgi:hypothetical protein
VVCCVEYVTTPSSSGEWYGVTSAGHLLSVTTLRPFFMMMYDIIVQTKFTIRTNVAVGRFSTRPKFYLFEAHRLPFIQHKSFHNHRFTRNSSNGHKYLDRLLLDSLDSTLFLYNCVKTK